MSVHFGVGRVRVGSLVPRASSWDAAEAVFGADVRPVDTPPARPALLRRSWTGELSG